MKGGQALSFVFGHPVPQLSIVEQHLPLIFVQSSFRALSSLVGLGAVPGCFGLKRAQATHRFGTPGVARISAQARATSESAMVLPGMVA